MTTTIDPDLLVSAADIYRRRTDQRFGGNLRWQQLKAELPEVAEAVRPRPSQTSELDEWRKEQEHEHRETESWIVDREELSMKRWSYRDVLEAADAKNPVWLVPNGTWHHSDRGRWAKGRSQASDLDGPGDDSDDATPRDRLVELHTETNGSYGIEDLGVKDYLLEVCRVCGGSLDLPRDEDSVVVRGRGKQPEYCSTRCRQAVNTVRKRLKRAKQSRKRTSRPPFDLGSVTIAGVGKIEYPAHLWNRIPAKTRAGIEAKLIHRHREVSRIFDPAIGSGLTSARVDPERIARTWGDWQSYSAEYGTNNLESVHAKT